MAYYPLSLEKRQTVIEDGANLFALFQEMHDSFDGRPMTDWSENTAPDWLKPIFDLDIECNFMLAFVKAGVASPSDDCILELERRINTLRTQIILPRIIRHMRRRV